MEENVLVEELAVHYDCCPAVPIANSRKGFAGKSEMMSQLLLGHLTARRVILSLSRLV